MAKTGEDNIQLLFPTVVQVSQIPDHERLNATLRDAIGDIRASEQNSKPSSWACDLYTTIGNPQRLLQYPGLDEFRDIIQAKLLSYARTLAYDVERMPPRMHECWVNVYGAGQAQEIHLHRNSVISGIYYVQAPEHSGATLFYSPAADVMLEPRAVKGNNLNATVTGFPPVEGRMLLFRSSLRHSVLPGDFNGERITIAFNAVM